MVQDRKRAALRPPDATEVITTREVADGVASVNEGMRMSEAST